MIELKNVNRGHVVELSTVKLECVSNVIVTRRQIVRREVCLHCGKVSPCGEVCLHVEKCVSTVNHSHCGTKMESEGMFGQNDPR